MITGLSTVRDQVSRASDRMIRRRLKAWPVLGTGEQVRALLPDGEPVGGLGAGDR